MTKEVKLVSDFNYFHRVNVGSPEDGDKFVYYPEATWPDHRSKFVDMDTTRVGGFAVYDTRVSSDYAVALYADEKDAKAHEVHFDKAMKEVAATIDEAESQDSDRLINNTTEATEAEKVEDAKESAAPKSGIRKRT